jgi:hypothetical protein
VAAGGVARGWDSEFESALLQQAVCLSREPEAIGEKPRTLAAVWGRLGT